jgi:hypothetical protein
MKQDNREKITVALNTEILAEFKTECDSGNLIMSRAFDEAMSVWLKVKRRERELLASLGNGE